ncbi:MAG: helix-turn-helix domain-containing protein [Byssovorax sp.]
MIAPNSPGPLLRSLRIGRRMTQEELARRAEISTRHLSCLETGRALPSRTMLLILGSAMDVPLRVRNDLLAAAGFTPVYRTSPLEDPAMSHVQHAVARILRLHEPHPAMLLDRSWNILQVNGGAARLFDWCGIRLSGAGPISLVRTLFDESLGLRSCLVNFDVIAAEVLARVRTEADVDPSLRTLLVELERLRGKPNHGLATGAAAAVALPIHIRRGDTDLRYFTTLTTLGTPLDVTAQELRIEVYFALDRATEEFGRALAERALASRTP